VEVILEIMIALVDSLMGHRFDDDSLSDDEVDDEALGVGSILYFYV
jgi:hypothetical protein